MSDSEGELSSAANIPADSEIEKGIRNVVRDAVKKDEEALTVKVARTRAEERLGLEAGFLKDNAQWKKRSKDLIEAAFNDPPSPEAPKKTAPATKAKPAPKAGTKRKSDEAQPVKKKQKKSQIEDSDDDSGVYKDENSDHSEANAVKRATRAPKRESKSEDEGELSDPPEDDEKPDHKDANGKDAADDESDLSSVIDEPAPKKKRQKKGAASSGPRTKAAKPKKPAKVKASAEDDESDLSSVLDDPPPKKSRGKKKSTSPKPKSKPKPAGKDLTPDEEEIKRLQSWLLKCGIRKLWHRELAPFDTSKEKIKHLKGMLEEVGMTGRFSAEKAKQIKEARELKAELEAVEEFEKTWGHEGEGKEGSGGEEDKAEEEKKPEGRRARPKGFVDFGDSDEESE